MAFLLSVLAQRLGFLTDGALALDLKERGFLITSAKISQTSEVSFSTIFFAALMVAKPLDSSFPNISGLKSSSAIFFEARTGGVSKSDQLRLQNAPNSRLSCQADFDETSPAYL